MSAPQSDPLVRMLTLLPWLRARGSVGLTEVAEHFGISEGQLRQELAILTFVGPGQGGGELVDISYEDGLITVHDPQGLEFPMRLGTAEAASLIAGLSLLSELPSDQPAGSLPSPAATALAKLEEATGAAIGEAFVLEQDRPPSEVDSVVRAALAAATVLRLWYAGAARDELTERRVDPVGLVVVDGRSYLEAWCHEAEGVRLFRLDRVARIEDTGEPIDRSSLPDRIDPESARVPEGKDARVLLAPSAQHVIELPACLSFERLADGSFDAVIRYADEDWIVRLALSLGSDVRIVDDPVLAAAIGERAEAALAAYPDRPSES